MESKKDFLMDFVNSQEGDDDFDESDEGNNNISKIRIQNEISEKAYFSLKAYVNENYLTLLEKVSIDDVLKFIVART